MENYKCKSVGIVGSGIQGVCTGLQLIKKGIPVTIFDRHDPLSKELNIRETGSITGTIEADDVEIHGHLDGKVSAQNIVVGATGTVKGDIEFGNNLRTENGADIDGYIKKTNTSKSKLSGDFLFKKKEKKEPSETEERPEVVNKEALA